MNFTHRCIVAAACATAFFGGAAEVRGEVRALLLGATVYHSGVIPDLEGPANDLVAVERMLRKEGSTDITVLANEDLTRTKMETAFHAMGLRSKPGDWIVFYYSGHGAQAKAADLKRAPTGTDEFLVLPGFDLDHPDAERYIIDHDLRGWMLHYVPASVTVLQVIDACHSGAFNRSIDRRAWRFRPRLAFSRDIGDTLELKARPGPQLDRVPGAPAESDVADEYLPNVIYVGAAQEDQFALEAALPGESPQAPSRGLLTYSFEHGLTELAADGRSPAADADHDGRVTLAELKDYLNTQTRQWSGQRQEPSIQFRTSMAGQSLFTRVNAPVSPPPPAPRATVFAADPRARALLASDDAWATAASAEHADFVWDYATGAVLRRSGDVVAERVSSLAAFKGVFDKWAAVAALRPLLSEGLARVEVGPKANGARYAEGAHVQLKVVSRVATAAPAYVTVFNLASDGQVQALYPVASDGEGRLGPGESLPVLETQVTTPYGADHVVALVTPDRPDGFRALLKSVDGTRGAARLLPALKSEMARGGATGLSVGELYTGAG